MREHARICISSVEHADLDRVEILRCRNLRGDAVPAAAIRAEVEALPAGILVSGTRAEAHADSRLEGGIAACHAQRAAPAADGKHITLRATSVDVLRDVYVRRRRLARQTHRVAADGIRQTIHGAVGHDTVQRGSAYAVATIRPLFREQSGRAACGVVLGQAEVTVTDHIERSRQTAALQLRAGPVQRAGLRVADKFNQYRGRFAILKREAHAEPLPARRERTRAHARRAAERRTAFIAYAVAFSSFITSTKARYS